MKWSTLLSVAVLIAMIGISGSAVASEPGDELREGLIDLVEHGDPDVRAAAVIVVGHIGTDEQRERIEAFRHSDHAQERMAAGAALIVTGDTDGVEVTVEQLLDASNTYEALRTLSMYLDDEALLRVVNTALDEADSAQRRGLFRFLGAQTGVLYDSLTDQLTASDDELREAAHQAFVYTAGEEALTVASGLSGHRTVAIRNQAIDVAEALSGRSEMRSAVIELLEDMVTDSDADLQRRAARLLVELGQQQGADVLAARLSGMDSSQRIETLEFLLAHDAQASLGEIRPLIAALDGQDEVDQQERQLLYEFAATDADDALFQELRDKFSSTDINDRLVAVRALGRTGHGGALELLSRGLGEGRSDIRKFSAKGYGYFGDPETLGELRSALTGESNQEIKLELIHSVGQIRDARAAQVLRFLTRDRDDEIRMAVVEALGEIGLPEAVSALDHLVQDRNPEIKWRAFELLLGLDADRAQQHISSMFRNPPDRFSQHLTPHQMPRRARESVYQELLTHSASRVRSVGVEHATANRDLLMPVVRQVLLNGDVSTDTRRDLAFLVIAQGEGADVERLQRVVASHKEEPAAQVAAWYLAHHAQSEFGELFEELMDGDDIVLGLIGRLGKANIE